jgi:hypothetical protein
MSRRSAVGAAAGVLVLVMLGGSAWLDSRSFDALLTSVEASDEALQRRNSEIMPLTSSYAQAAGAERQRLAADMRQLEADTLRRVRDEASKPDSSESGHGIGMRQPLEIATSSTSAHGPRSWRRTRPPRTTRRTTTQT